MSEDFISGVLTGLYLVAIVFLYNLVTWDRQLCFQVIVSLSCLNFTLNYMGFNSVINRESGRCW